MYIPSKVCIKKTRLMFWLCTKVGIMRAHFLKFKKAAISKYFLYVLHSFISYNPGWNESKLILPKVQVKIFSQIRIIYHRKEKNLKSKKIDTKKLFHDS